MKKLVLLLAVAFSVSMFSCGGADKKAEEAAADSTPVVEEVAVVEVAADSVVADSAAADTAAVVAE